MSNAKMTLADVFSTLLAAGLLEQIGITRMKWTVYILECSDNSLYTGITNDMERRLEEHRTGRGAKYTKHRRPLRVRYTEYQCTKRAALKREAAIKSLDRVEKLALIATRPPAELRGTISEQEPVRRSGYAK